jgi:hypothetical protein
MKKCRVMLPQTLLLDKWEDKLLQQSGIGRGLDDLTANVLSHDVKGYFVCHVFRLAISGVAVMRPLNGQGC